MTLADELAVRAVLAKYETPLFHAVRMAWEDWKALPLGGRLWFAPRSRACLVYDFIVVIVHTPLRKGASLMICMA